MKTPLLLDYAEFYITNSCNFNCNGCNRFNNYKFTGMQKWKDYSDIYQQWSTILDLKRWSILGGEPMLNPDYLEWLNGVSTLWPTACGELLTNGYYLKSNNRDLYDIIKHSQGRINLNIGLHNINRREQVLDTVKSWLRGNITISIDSLESLPNLSANWKKSYAAIRDPSWPDCDSVQDWDNLTDAIKHECEQIFQLSPQLLANTRLGQQLVDSNGVKVNIQMENYFHQGALIRNTTQSFQLHNSDPMTAHDQCHSKTCHHFDKGKLYKCGQTALFSEIDQQFVLNISSQDRELIYSYHPGSVDQSWQELANFINNIKQPIPQCKFCPEQYQVTEFSAGHGQKINMVKRKKIKDNSVS